MVQVNELINFFFVSYKLILLSTFSWTAALHAHRTRPLARYYGQRRARDIPSGARQRLDASQTAGTNFENEPRHAFDRRNDRVKKSPRLPGATDRAKHWSKETTG